MVTYQEYNKDFLDFNSRHGHAWHVETTDIINNSWMKIYTFGDGAKWWESIGPSFESVDVVCKGVHLRLPVKLLRVEYWTSESSSKFYYDKF